MNTDNKRFVSVVFLLVSWLSLNLNLVDSHILVKASSDIICVPDNYQKIQWAIDNASAGSTIFVSSGVYYEHLIIDKALTLKGENRESIIDGNGTGNVVTVTANNVSISGFAIQNSGPDFWDSGIRLYFSSGQNISYNTLINNAHGIWFDGCNHSTISENEILNNKCGIGLSSSNNNTIANNRVFSSDDCGIGLDYSSNNTIIGNAVENNGYGIWVCSAEGNIVFHNNIINNTKQTHCYNSTNTWDNNSRGNYWSDYDGKDADLDGIGDTPYEIDLNNIDYYPLMETVVLPELSNIVLLIILALATTALLKRFASKAKK